MARVGWPSLPAGVLVDEIRDWWDASRQEWSRRIHGFYRVIGRGVTWPIRAAWDAVAGPQSDPLAVFQRQERAAIVLAVEKLLDELDRLAQVGNDTLRPRLLRLLGGRARATCSNACRRPTRAFRRSMKHYREFLRGELDAWRDANPRAVRFLQSLDHAAALARPAITVALFFTGLHFAGDLAGQAAAHAAGAPPAISPPRPPSPAASPAAAKPWSAPPAKASARRPAGCSADCNPATPNSAPLAGRLARTRVARRSAGRSPPRRGSARGKRFQEVEAALATLAASAVRSRLPPFLSLSPMIRRIDTPAEVPLPLLITGVAGVPGYNAMDVFPCEISGPGRRHPPGRQLPPGRAGRGRLQRRRPRRAGPAVRATPIRRRARLRRQLRLKQCELAPEIAWRINVEGVQNLLSQTVPRGLRLVHLSCDLVFSGDDGRGGYVETDPTDPVTVYGRTMAAAEEVVLAADPTACILRISLPMGVSFSGHAGAIDWIMSRFKKSRPATLYFDEIRTPTYTDCLNRLYETDALQRAERHFSRRWAAVIEPLPDRADHQSRGRIRCELSDGHAAARRRPDPAAGRQRLHGLRQADPPPWASTRSTRGLIATRSCPRTPIGTASVRPTSPVRRSSCCGCWRRTRMCAGRFPACGRACATAAMRRV